MVVDDDAVDQLLHEISLLSEVEPVPIVSHTTKAQFASTPTLGFLLMRYGVGSDSGEIGSGGFPLDHQPAAVLLDIDAVLFDGGGVIKQLRQLAIYGAQVRFGGCDGDCGLGGERGGVVGEVEYGSLAAVTLAADVRKDFAFEVIRSTRVVRADRLIGASFGLVVAVGGAGDLASSATPLLASRDANHARLILAAPDQSGEQEVGRMADAGRGTPLRHELSNGQEVGLRDDGVVIALDHNAESLVAADVDRIEEQVTNRNHAPVAAASGAQPIAVETLGDASNAERFAQIQVEDAAHDGGFLIVNLVAAIGVNGVAVGCATDGLTALSAVMLELAAALRIRLELLVASPQVDQRLIVNAAILKRDQLHAARSEL